ncbi:MAG TPA: DUF4231 domain-containing protein [Blastocatellia bacterium]|jgi:hypothetical protein|nr:DUF4231 domain-containing protein [Blastocatellia bacterium]
MSGEINYLAARLEEQGRWHSKKATWNKRRYYTVEIITILAGALIPIINAVDGMSEYNRRLSSSLLAALVVTVVAISKLFKFQENWLNYRAIAESLKRERELFVNEVGDYRVADEKERTRLLVERGEAILASAISQFVALHRPEPVKNSNTTGA